MYYTVSHSPISISLLFNAYLYYPPTHPAIRIILLSIHSVLSPPLSSVSSSYPYTPYYPHPCHSYYLPIHALRIIPTPVIRITFLSVLSVLSSYPPCHPHYLPIHTLRIILTPVSRIILLSVLCIIPLPTPPSILSSYQTFGRSLTLHAFPPKCCITSNLSILATCPFLRNARTLPFGAMTERSEQRNGTAPGCNKSCIGSPKTSAV